MRENILENIGGAVVIGGLAAGYLRFFFFLLGR